MLQSGLFWTIAIPDSAFYVTRSHARLKLADVPLCDSFSFGNPQGVASQVSMVLRWDATNGRVDRGQGASVDPTSPDAFEGSFAESTCVGSVSGTETGFSFETQGELDASGFFAEFGRQANGVFL